MEKITVLLVEDEQTLAMIIKDTLEGQNFIIHTAADGEEGLRKFFDLRPDVLVAACLAAMNGVEIGALLLTGGYEMDARISKLCERAFATGLPVFMVNTNTWQTSLSLQSFNLEVPVDDHERIEKVQEYVANYINADWIESLTATSERSRRLSPPAFRYQLTELARKAGKRIVLPEGDEPRTVKAAAICAERGIATCVLLGNPAEINRVAASQGVELGAGIEIVGRTA